MSIIHIISYLNIIAWASAAIRQRHARYYPFFLVLAVTDPVTILLKEILFVSPYQVYLVSSVFLLTVMSEIKVGRHSLIVLTLMTMGVLLFTGSTPRSLIMPIALLNTGVLIIMIRKIFVILSETNELKVYHTLLLLYQITVVIKFIMIIAKTSSGIIYFYTDSAFEILIGIYFAVFRENLSRALFRVKEVRP